MAEPIALTDAAQVVEPPVDGEAAVCSPPLVPLPDDLRELFELAWTYEFPPYHGPPMESNDALLNLMLLFLTLREYLARIRTAFIGVDMAVYYQFSPGAPDQMVAPDFFVVLDVEDGFRKSFVTFREGGRTPDVVIEMRSPSTAVRDRTTKRQIYQNVLKVGEYFRFDPPSGRLDGERLLTGEYQRIEPETGGRLYCEQLDLYLVLWEGEYQSLRRRWLRWQLADGTLLSTPEEREEAQRRRAEELERRAGQFEQRAAELQRGQEEQQRLADEQRRIAEEALAEVARLRALLNHHGSDEPS